MKALPIDLEEITLEDIERAIKGMRHHKASGEDNIAVELVKATSDENLIAWLKLYSCVGKTQKILLDWRNGTIVKIP